MPTIAQRVAGMQTTIFSEINNYAAQFDTVNLGQGKPDFDGPQEVLDAMIDAVKSGAANQYPPGLGIPLLRQQIAEHAGTQYNLDIDPQAGVVVTSGASEGVFAAVMSVVNPGDEVILLEPYFDIYLPAVEWAGGIPVYVPLRPPRWQFDPDELRRAFSEKTRAIILNTPHNPTGRVFNREELTLISALCREYDAVVISDEVYEHLTYGAAEHTPIATLPGMFDRTLTVSSAAKTFSVTGWKVGWVTGHPDLITGVWRIHQNVTFTVNHPGQYGVAHGLSLGNTYFAAFQAMYAKKRDLLLRGLLEAGLKVNYAPEGAFYIMGDYSGMYDGEPLEFSRWLIREHGVGSIPPETFFSEPHRKLVNGYVRFSYCKTDESLQEAVRRLANVQPKKG